MKPRLSTLERSCTFDLYGCEKLKSAWFKTMEQGSETGEVVIGIDEVGRGSWFGPLIVAACANLTGWHLPAVKDSKLIRQPEKRKQLAGEIRHNCIWATVTISPKAINDHGTQVALMYAGRRVKDEIIARIEQVRPKCSYHVIYDGKDHPATTEEGCRVQSIEKADATIFPVMCASIVAKATHDVLIEKLCENAEYARYGIVNSRGYGTKKHVAALQAYGLSDQHRTAACTTGLTNYENADAPHSASRGRRTVNHTDGTRRVPINRAG